MHDIWKEEVKERNGERDAVEKGDNRIEGLDQRRKMEEIRKDRGNERVQGKRKRYKCQTGGEIEVNGRREEKGE